MNKYLAMFPRFSKERFLGGEITGDEALVRELFDPEYHQAVVELWKGNTLRVMKRLTQLLELDAPAVILENEMRMLKERFIEWASLHKGESYIKLIEEISGEKEEVA